MASSRSRDILGVDFSAGRLRAVQLRVQGGEVVLYKAAARDFSPLADGATLGEVLRSLLDEEEFTARQAVLGIPAGKGFVQVLSGDAIDIPPKTGYAWDHAPLDEERHVRVVTPQAEVERLREAAVVAGLDLQLVNLQAVGCLAALWADDEPVEPVGIVVGAHNVTMVVRDGSAPLAVHIRPRAEQDDVGLIERMFRLARTASAAGDAGCLRVILNEADRSLAEALSERLGVAVVAQRPGEGAGLDWPGHAVQNRADFAAATGLALLGVECASPGAASGPRCLNLLKGAIQRPGARRVSWPKVAGGVGAILLLVLVLLGAHAVGRHRELRHLRTEYAAIEEQARADREVLNRWRAMREWVPQSEGGHRPQDRTVMGEIVRLFSEDEQGQVSDAYLAWLTIATEPAGRGRMISMAGRARHRQAVYRFVSNLNESVLFDRARDGPITEVPDASEFTQRFTLDVHLRR